jgi:FMN reductase
MSVDDEMAARRSLVVISAGISSPSSTRLLADRLSESVVSRLRDEAIDVDVIHVELANLASDITSNMLTGFASNKLQSALDELAASDGAIMVTPVYTTSFGGLFKMFIDIIEVGALVDLPVLIAATGGTERHSLALDYSIRPLFVYHHAAVSPTGVFAATTDWGSAGTAAGGVGKSSGLNDRIGRAAIEFAGILRTWQRHQRVLDPFSLPNGFDPSGTTTSR